MSDENMGGYPMSERGGWSIIVESGAVTRLFVVANSNHEEAEKLALGAAGGGEVISYAEVPESRIASLNLQTNDVIESKDITRP
jgi:nitrous oxide reductase accessory protein NosL